MQRFKNIAVLLAETGEDARILKRALKLAKLNQASLSVYALFDKEDYVPNPDPALQPPADVVQHVQEHKSQRLKAAMEVLKDGGIPVTEQLLSGKPFIRVIQQVLKNGHDLLMLPAEEGRSDLALFLGGTPMHLLRKCPCAVWVFRAQRKRKFRRVLAAVNIAAQNHEEVTLNVKVMELGISMAEQEDADLHVVYCWTAFGESMLVNMGGLSGEERRTYVKDAKAQQQEMMHNFLLGFPINKDRTRTHLLKGDAGSMIPELAVKQGIELLVMGTVGRSGIPGFFMGNSAEKILNHVPCSVLAVKPDGFESPVPRERS